MTARDTAMFGRRQQDAKADLMPELVVAITKLAQNSAQTQETLLAALQGISAAKPPIVNVAAAETRAPIVNIAPAAVTVAAPNVQIQPEKSGMSMRVRVVKRDGMGNIQEAEISVQKT